MKGLMGDIESLVRMRGTGGTTMKTPGTIYDFEYPRQVCAEPHTLT